MFQEVQLAFSMLTVNAESMEALEATESFISKLPTPAASLPRKPTSGVNKIRIGDGVLFIGNIREGQPHGVGELILKDGAVHHGTFDRGRAEGLGILYTANGSVFRGNSCDLSDRVLGFDCFPSLLRNENDLSPEMDV